MDYNWIIFILFCLLVAYEAYLGFVKKTKPINVPFFIFIGLTLLLRVFGELAKNGIISDPTLQLVAKVIVIVMIVYAVFLLARWLKLPEKIRNMLGPINKGE